MSLLTKYTIKTKKTKNISPLDSLNLLCKNNLKLVNIVLLEQLESTIPFITQLSTHLIQSGGKRIRPLLTLASAAMCNYKGKNHIPLAASVEMIHTATLLHDDVVDKSQKRRNKFSVNAIWGNSASILVGDFLFSKAFILMIKYGSKEVLKTLSKTSSTIAEGEIFQLTQLNHPSNSIETYLNIINRKTACLFSAACRIGGLISNTSNIMLKSLENYGHNLGLAFQITDDLLDYNAIADNLGKNIGEDFWNGKITLPCMLAFQKSNQEEKNFWTRTLVEKKYQKDDFKKALSIIQKYKSYYESLNIAKKYVNNAKNALQTMPFSDLKKCLQEIASYCVNRSF